MINFLFLQDVASGGGFGIPHSVEPGTTVGQFIDANVTTLRWDRLAVRYSPKDVDAKPFTPTRDTVIEDGIILTALAKKLDGGGVISSIKAILSLAKIVSSDDDGIHNLQALASIGKTARQDPSFADNVIAGLTLVRKLQSIGDFLESDASAPVASAAAVRSPVANNPDPVPTSPAVVNIAVDDVSAMDAVGRIFVKTPNGTVTSTIGAGTTVADVFAKLYPTSVVGQFRIELNQRPTAASQQLCDNDVVTIAPLALVVDQLKKGNDSISL